MAGTGCDRDPCVLIRGAATWDRLAALGGSRRFSAPFRSADDSQRITAHQGAGGLHPRTPDDPVKRLPRNAHADGGIGVEQILDIGEPDGLEFVGRQDDLLEFIERDAGGLEVIAGRMMGDPAGTEWTGHGKGEVAACPAT